MRHSHFHNNQGGSHEQGSHSVATGSLDHYTMTQQTMKTLKPSWKGLKTGAGE